MATLLPDQLKTLWEAVAAHHLSEDEFQRQQEVALNGHEAVWKDALLLDDSPDLEKSLVAELARYVGSDDLTDIQRRCVHSSDGIEDEWHERVSRSSGDRASIEQFYDQSQRVLYELVWWHTLNDDRSPLAYVVALNFARQHGCRAVLDFGAGIGSGGILFARHGLRVSLADISTPLLRFSEWRFAQRHLPGEFIDLKDQTLPPASFDLVTAMDVFEHLVDPLEAVDRLAESLRPGGVLFGRFNVEAEDERPEHIVHDFAPVFGRMEEHGLVPVWEDQWLWGHQAFRKSGEDNAGRSRKAS
jgi:2-polyprenyl-3-methyl-5-hydroxy-6-metoxy-1,4-benzoquinol methylase